VQALFQQVCAVVGQLAEQVTTLEARLHKDSHNSHKPPSSDGPAKPVRSRSLRKRSGKKSGGQVGHPGATLRLVEQPDVTIPHSPATCQQCG
jgi:hypothetical protein